MSQVAKRKGPVIEEKDTKRTDSPVKDMKKKMAANADKEKEKQTEKVDKPTEKSQPAKPADKPSDNAKQNEKTDSKNAKQNEKVDNKAVKQNEKVDSKNEKPKAAEKPAENAKASTSEKPADKKVEKNGVDAKKTDKKEADKKESQEKKDDKVEKNGKTDKQKQNGAPKQNGSKHNGDSNGVDESDDDVLEIADDEFPELAYDEGSDVESPSPDAQSRSLTRRSQVKSTRTPETPQPAAATDESKVLKLSEAPSDRKLRSADSPKPDGKKENGDKDKDGDIIDLDDDEPRKTDTNYSKSRVKVSPYRRSLRLADQTASSAMADYTGNNTTMEMDITESSIAEESPNDSYLQGLRTIRARRSYKHLQDLPPVVRKPRNTAAVECSGRPTAPVVGRKRKPEGGAEPETEIATDAAAALHAAPSKRMRLLERIAHPFRRSFAAGLPARRHAEIVGINTDLPLTAPVAAPSFDPETLKAAQETSPAQPQPLPTVEDRDGKRCIVM